MPVADRLKVLDGNDITDSSGSKNLFEFESILGVSENVADGKHHVVAFDSLDDTAAGFCAGSHRFFQQDVIFEVGTGNGRLLMHIILSADGNGVTESGDLDEIFPGLEAVFLRDVVLFDKTLAPIFIRLGDSDDLETLREARGKSGISVAAGTGSDNGNSHGI